MEKVIISKENIEKAIQQGAQSISQIYKMLGGSGNIGGSTVKKIRELVPDIAERLNANKNKPTDKAVLPQEASVTTTPASNPTKADKPTKAITTVKSKQSKEPKPTRKSKYPRHPANPYRPGSSYGVAFDIIATKKDGISRDELTNLLSKETGKPVKNAGYDLSVVLSPTESPTGHRHKSAKDGYYLKKENRHYTLMLP